MCTLYCMSIRFVCIRTFFCARQCSKPCDASSVSEEAGNLGFGFSPELLSFTFSSGMLPSGAHTLSLPQTHTESLIITGQSRSVQTGSAASFLCRIKTPVPFLPILNIGLQTLKKNYTLTDSQKMLDKVPLFWHGMHDATAEPSLLMFPGRKEG